MCNFFKSSYIWMAEAIKAFMHWFTFGVILSLVPYIVFVKMTGEELMPGFVRVLTEAALKGELYIVMIPLVGTLIGENVTRTFFSSSLEGCIAVFGLVILILLISATAEFRDLTDKDLAVVSRQEHILKNNKDLFFIMLIYGAVVMLMSSTHRNK